MIVECKSTVQADPGDYLQAEDVAAWVGTIPPGARLSAVIRDHGSQRDPVPILTGLRADWTENRL